MSHLAEASTPQRGSDVPVAAAGRFRVHLGMASRVGKTCAMLDEAARRAARGCDVVAGSVETHGRPATPAKLGGLAVVPPKAIVHRQAARFAEMDLGAILARRPEPVWQGILELLDAEFSLIGTLHTRHVEGLADVVEAITGDRGIARPTISAAGGPHPGQAWPEGSAAPTSASDQGESAATIWWQDGRWKKCR
ncbi:hypothetical protein [Streptomyces brasiliensis]|nr:hypothetical protein [Streptomyces brasiliensis]